jgi:hypothetical protein
MIICIAYLLVATTTTTAGAATAARKTNRVRAALQRRTRALAYTAHNTRTALKCLAEKTKNGRHVLLKALNLFEPLEGLRRNQRAATPQNPLRRRHQPRIDRGFNLNEGFLRIQICKTKVRALTPELALVPPDVFIMKHVHVPEDTCAADGRKIQSNRPVLDVRGINSATHCIVVKYRLRGTMKYGPRCN